VKLPPPLTAAEAFEGFAKVVLPSNATPTQVEVSRVAFMGGLAFLLAQLEHYVAAPEVSEDVSHAYLSAMHEEVHAFLQRGRESTTPDPRAELGQMNYTTPDPDQIRSQLNDIGHGIGERLPPGYGFLLLIFTFGEGGSMFYISNGEREDMMAAMREFIRKQTQ
jgi:hypothetical protein